MRRPKACTLCRLRRKKCVVQTGHDTCNYCVQQDADCIQELPRGGWYDKRARKKQRIIGDSIQRDGAPKPINTSDRDVSTSEDQPIQLPGLELLLEIVELYFDYVHDVFHCLFHKPTFLEDVADGRVPHSILFAILGLGARFSTNPVFSDIEPRNRGRRYMEEAERRLSLRNVSFETIQLSVLIAAGATGDGNTESENLFFTVGCRTAQLLGLPHRAAASPLEEEINLRLWWSLCMIDVWSCTASKVPRLLPANGHGVPLPMDDLPFHNMRRAGYGLSNPSIVYSRRSPLITQMVHVNRILLEIHDFNQQCVAKTLSVVEVENGVQTLSQRMDAWLAELPHDVRDTADNLSWFNANGLGRTYAAVYLGYYHFGQLLYYQFLHRGISEGPGSPSRVYSDRCKRHSAQLCDMIYRAVFTPGSDIRYFMVAHVIVIASTVQIHTLLFAEDDIEITAAKRRLEKNFEILLLLRPYWPALDYSMARLRAFHKTCRVNMSTSFVLDGWMLQFLVGFGDFKDDVPVRSRPELEEFYRLDDIIS